MLVEKGVGLAYKLKRYRASAAARVGAIRTRPIPPRMFVFLKAPMQATILAALAARQIIPII
jgi:hypothetical protein